MRTNREINTETFMHILGFLQNRYNFSTQDFLKNAKIEINYFQDYNYLIINDNLEIAAKELVSIANITRIKTKLFEKEKIVSNWLSN